MEDTMKKTQTELGDKEIIYSKAIKAGKRIYYIDVKKNLRDDLFIAVTESKKVQPKDGSRSASFEKHQIFLYQEDFDKFMLGMSDVINYIKLRNAENPKDDAVVEYEADDSSDEIKLDIDF